MSEPTPKDPRGPTNLRIKFRSASLEQFIERYAVDVSRGGIFIRTREPLPVDTRLRLEFQLQDATPLLAGEGTVVWIREHDPTRENVTPGMGVRFDKLTPETQPTLEKILAEKTRLEQAGIAAVGQPKGGGMAVRRPSGVFASLDANARAVLGAGLPQAPAEPTATGPESTPISAPPPPATPKTSFLSSRSGAPVAPASPAQSGPFTRARSTTTRPVPVPSALFEPPTAADIDKALEVLQEAPGPAPAVRPTPSAPRYVADDASNEPTRVADIVDELVGGGSGPRAVPMTLSAPGTGDGTADATGEPDGVGQEPAGSPPAATLDEPLEIADVDVEPAVPEAQAAVAAPVAPEPSKRFRAASRAYPTLNRRRSGLTTFLVVLVVLGAAAGAAVKLHLKDRFFPTAGAPPQAPIAAPAAPATQAPAATAPSAAPSAPAAQEGAGGAAAVAAAPPQQAAPEEKAAPEKAPEKPAPEKASPGKAAAEKAATEKAATDEKKSAAAENEEHAAKHHPLHHKAEVAAAAASAGAEKPAAEKPAAEKPAPEKPAAEQPAPEKAAEGAPAEKPAAAAPAPVAPILKVTSSPSGAQVLIDGRELGMTPFVSKEVDPSAPHTITIKKDGFEPNERMVSGLDWSRPHGSSPQTLKVNAKLRRSAAAPGATPAPAPPKENAEPEDTGGPYIKEIKPDSP